MRWYQLTYASTDASSGRAGGWDVQYVSPAIPDPLLEKMRAGVTTRLETLDRLDEFSGEAELSSRTRRFSFRYFDDNGGCYVWWHAADAGRDATGRPGNVFTHVLAALQVPIGLRPIDYWRSPSWLMPFGLNEVVRATPEELVTQGPISRSSAIDHALAHPEETEALLAAVAMCRDEGRALILASRSQDVYATWIGVVSHLTSGPVAAGWLAFSTFDRVSRLSAVLEHSTMVRIAPEDLELAIRMALDPTQPNKLLVLDLDALPGVSAAGDWEYSGQRWRSQGLWLEAFFEITDETRYDRAGVDAILDRMDVLAGHDDNYPDCGAPLAAALLDSCDDDSVRSQMLDQWALRLGVGVSELETMMCVAPENVAGVKEPARHSEPDQGEVREPSAGPPEGAAVEVRVSFPSPAHTTTSHRRLAELLWHLPDVLPDTQARQQIAAWIHANQFDPRPTPQRIDVNDGVNHGTDS